MRLVADGHVRVQPPVGGAQTRPARVIGWTGHDDGVGGGGGDALLALEGGARSALRPGTAEHVVAHRAGGLGERPAPAGALDEQPRAVVTGRPYAAVLFAVLLLGGVKLAGCVVVVLVYGWNAQAEGRLTLPWERPNLLVWLCLVGAAVLSAVLYALGRRGFLKHDGAARSRPSLDLPADCTVSLKM